MMQQYEPGRIVLVRLGSFREGNVHGCVESPEIGCDGIDGARPCVVIAVPFAGMLLVAPTTKSKNSKQTEKNLPAHSFKINGHGFPVPSTVLCANIRCVSTVRVVRAFHIIDRSLLIELKHMVRDVTTTGDAHEAHRVEL
jgi:mRNA-degrading endonuclease toxin of MazEF toxin-antitoxin module